MELEFHVLQAQMSLHKNKGSHLHKLRILTTQSQVVLTICVWCFFQSRVSSGQGHFKDPVHSGWWWTHRLQLEFNLPPFKVLVAYMSLCVTFSYKLLQDVNSASTINSQKFTAYTIYWDYETGVGSIMCVESIVCLATANAWRSPCCQFME